MRKLFTLLIPISILFSLVGCGLSDEKKVTYIRKDFRESVMVDRATDDMTWGKEYQIKIDGKWYDADENGNLTERGKKQKQHWEMSPNNPANSGGGC